MTKYKTAAIQAVLRALQSQPSVEAVTAVELSRIADEAARKAGRRQDLFESLSEYDVLHPVGAKSFLREGLRYVTNPFYGGKRDLRRTQSDAPRASAVTQTSCQSLSGPGGASPSGQRSQTA